MSSDLFARSGTPQPHRHAQGDAGDPLFRDDGAAGKQQVREAEILAAIDDVPALSHVVSQILSMSGDHHSSAGQMEGLVKQDMVITGRLLKLVNSPFYGLPNRISSLAQSMAIVGMNSLRSLVVAASCSSLLRVDLSGYGYDAEGLWKNSLATGALAREIGIIQGGSPERVEDLFLAGLLRDIGMLVLAPFLDREHAVIERSQNDIIYRERQLLGFDHCWAGGRISEKWNLPRSLHIAVTCHHRIPPDVGAEHAQMLVAVRIAERLAIKSGIGVLENHPFETEIDGRLLKAAHMDRQHFAELVAKVPDVIASAAIDMSE
jgi:HD-like signal output (HDOD) protein